MGQARILLDRLETVAGGHLMMRIDRPAEPRDAKLCVLYMHGFGSRQTGTKAEFFRRSFQHYGIDFWLW